jgi:hypothetical protein
MVKGLPICALTNNDKSFIILCRIWSPPCLDAVFLFKPTDLFVLGKPSCVCRPISCPDISNLLPRVLVVNDIIIESFKFNFCLVRLVPDVKFNIITKLHMVTIMVYLLKTIQLCQMINVIGLLSNFWWFNT